MGRGGRAGVEAGAEGRRLTRLPFLPRFLLTSAFRYTLIYTAFFAASLAAIGYFVYEATIGETMERLEADLVSDLTYLARINKAAGADGYKGLSDAINETQRLKVLEPSARYLVVLDGRALQSDFVGAPREMASATGMFEFDYLARTVDDGGEVVYVPRPAVGYTAEFLYGRPDGGTARAVILAARDITTIDRIRQDARGVIFRVGGASLALGLVLGAIYSGAILRRVERIGRTVSAISQGDLTRRVALSGSDDEFDRLSGNINAMLDQIERLMTGMRQVSDNIAHDLRSPLTRIKARLESALSDGAADREAVLERTTDDVERLLATFNALLSITRLESGEGGGSKVLVDIGSVAEELAELYEPAADDAGFALRTRIEPVPPIWGSRELVSQLIANLLDNALKYAARGEGQEGGVQPVVELSVGRGPRGGAVLSVADNGPGVSEADQERILRRFVRLERSRSTQGNGLGLSLVAAIARRHDAKLSIGRGLPHQQGGRALRAPSAYGLGVRVVFPPAPEGADQAQTAAETTPRANAR